MPQDGTYQGVPYSPGPVNTAEKPPTDPEAE